MTARWLEPMRGLTGVRTKAVPFHPLSHCSTPRSEPHPKPRPPLYDWTKEQDDVA